MRELSAEARATLRAAEAELAPPLGARARIRAGIEQSAAAPSEVVREVEADLGGPTLGPSASSSGGGLGAASVVAGGAAALAVAAALLAPPDDTPDGRAGALPAPLTTEVSPAFRATRIEPPATPNATPMGPTPTGSDRATPRGPTSSSGLPPPDRGPRADQPAARPGAPKSAAVRADAAAPSEPRAVGATAPGPELTLAEEARLLARARRHLAASEPAAALEVVAEHRIRFPQGALRIEALAIRALARCASGQRTEAGADRARVAEQDPESPYLLRIDARCGQD